MSAGRKTRIGAGLVGLAIIVLALLNSPRSTPTEWATNLSLIAITLMISTFMITRD